MADGTHGICRVPCGCARAWRVQEVLAQGGRAGREAGRVDPCPLLRGPPAGWVVAGEDLAVVVADDADSARAAHGIPGLIAIGMAGEIVQVVRSVVAYVIPFLVRGVFDGSERL